MFKKGDRVYKKMVMDDGFVYYSFGTVVSIDELSWGERYIKIHLDGEIGGNFYPFGGSRIKGFKKVGKTPEKKLARKMSLYILKRKIRYLYEIPDIKFKKLTKESADAMINLLRQCLGKLEDL